MCSTEEPATPVEAAVPVVKKETLTPDPFVKKETPAAPEGPTMQDIFTDIQRLSQTGPKSLLIKVRSKVTGQSCAYTFLSL